jgi:hypothetical protein
MIPKIHEQESRRADGHHLLQLIGETSPYVALRDIFIDDAQVVATFRRDQQRYKESTTVSCSEASRTMAIHGCLAAAHANPVARKHYYLAVKGSIDWADGGLLPHSDELFLSGRVIGEVKKLVEAEVQCFTSRGELYATFQSHYLVVPEEDFFAKMGRSESASLGEERLDFNPYADPLRLEHIRYDGDKETVEATLGATTDADFRGHFDGCPLCPVAIVGGNLFAMIGHFPGVESYSIRRMSYVCRRATRPGERVRLVCEKTSASAYRLSTFDGQDKLVNRFDVLVEHGTEESVRESGIRTVTRATDSPTREE